MKSTNQAFKNSYKKALEVSTIVSLVLCNLAFLSLRNFHLHAETQSFEPEILIVEPPPETEQRQPPKEPSRPPQVVPSTDANLPEELTIDPSLSFDLTTLPVPPPLPEKDPTPFYLYDKAPELIGGLDAIKKSAQYPEMARKVHIEGTAVVHVLVDERGMPALIKIFKSAGSELLDEAALVAARKLRWHPAKQRDKSVKAWVKIPFKFELR